MKITLTKDGNTFYPYSQEDEEKASKLSNAIYVIDIKNSDMRTLKQNNAIHLWASQIAGLLNKNALYMTGVFGNKIEWSMNLVKEQIIKATMKQVFNKDSTTKLTKKEIDSLIDFVTQAFATKGIEIPPFPSRELWEDKNKKDKV